MVLPAYNEQRRIGATLRDVAGHLREGGLDAAIVVVDNGSTDQTVDIVDDLGDLGVAISVIGCARQGKGAAVRRGVLSTRSRYVGFCDADSATPAATFGRVMPLLRAGSPVVIGSRRCPGAQYLEDPPPLRRVGGWVFRRAASVHVRGVADTQCGFKFFDARAAKQLFAASTLDGFAFDVELLALAQARGFEVVEVPVQWTSTAGSTVSIGAGLRALRDISRPRRLAWADGPG